MVRAESGHFAADLIRRLDQFVDNVVWFESVDSTHAAAIRLMEQVDSEDLVLRPNLILATAQSTGIGRGGRQWVSPSGGLYLNWVAACLSDSVVSYLPMLSAAAAISGLLGIEVRNAGIKWPNDILVDGRKLAGLLIHARRAQPTLVTVGLGVNLRPIPPLPEDAIQPATSLDEILGIQTPLDLAVDLVVGFVRRLVESLDDPAPALVLWRKGLIHRDGDPLKVRLASGEEMSGLFAGLTDEGFLRLDLDGEVRVITGGDVIEGA